MAVPSFTISIPSNTAALSGRPLMIVKVLIDLETDAAVQFEITKKMQLINPPSSVTQGPKQFPDAPGSYGPSSAVTDANKFQTGQLSADTIAFALPFVLSGTPATDPLRRRYVISLLLLSDYDTGNQCVTKIAAPDTVTIAVKTGSPLIVGAYLVSFSTIGTAPCPVTGQNGNTAVVLPNAAPPLGVAEVQGIPGGVGPDRRPGIDVVLVLDRSGSMAGARIADLHKAFVLLKDVWTNLRTSEGAGTPSDNIGVTIFDDQVDWWNPPVSPPLAKGLNLFAEASPSITLSNMTDAASGITARGMTSIGGGLKQAAELGTVGSNRRRVILLMTDGWQNTEPLVAVNGVGSAARVYLHTDEDATYSPSKDLVHQGNYQIYVVTVGTASTVDAKVAIDLAQATKGFYLNSETDPSKQNVFFLQLLQNFVRFTTWETHRIISAKLKSSTDVFTTTNPFSTTTTAVVVALRAPSRANANLRLTVTPPGGDPAASRQVVETDNGLASLRFAIPTSPDYDYVGDWTITVDEAPIVINVAPRLATSRVAAAPAPTIDFDLVIIADDAALDAQVRVVPKNYAPGDAVELEARVTEFGRPVTGLGNGTGSQILVEVVQPGVGVGDLLSTSAASTAQPFQQDQLSAVQAKLYNHLQGAPDALGRHAGNVVTLTEGSDGVYRGSFPVQTSGHYDFVFGLRGTAPNVARFTRQHFETVYVRALPSASATDVQTSVLTIPGGQQLQINFTPRTRFFERLGPGWANYFWFTAPDVTPFKPIDNLDGTFAATLDFTGPVPPVSLHFLDVAVKIGDSVPFDKLPVPLGSGSVLVPSVKSITAPYITTWLVLGPIFDPAHQPGPHADDVSRPEAAALLTDIDQRHDQLDPGVLTADPAHAPSHGDVLRTYGGSLVAGRAYEWRKRRFEGMDWSNASDIGDDVHSHLGGDYQADPADPGNHLNFAGKHHAMAFFLVYIVSPDSRRAFIEVGHDDAIRLWLNGAEIIEPGILPFLNNFDLTRGHPSFARVSLKAGTNVLLAAVAETHIDWGFSLRILDHLGLRISADNPGRDPIIRCESEYHSVTVAGDGNLWNPNDLDRALSCVGGRTWKGRVRLTDEHFKLVAHRHHRLPDWWGPRGKNIFLDNFHNETPGIYDLVFSEDDPAHPVLILVKPFAAGIL